MMCGALCGRPVEWGEVCLTCLAAVPYSMLCRVAQLEGALLLAPGDEDLLFDYREEWRAMVDYLTGGEPGDRSFAPSFLEWPTPEHPDLTPDELMYGRRDEVEVSAVAVLHGADGPPADEVP